MWYRLLWCTSESLNLLSSLCNIVKYCQFVVIFCDKIAANCVSTQGGENRRILLDLKTVLEEVQTEVKREEEKRSELHLQYTRDRCAWELEKAELKCRIAQVTQRGDDDGDVWVDWDIQKNQIISQLQCFRYSLCVLEQQNYYLWVHIYVVSCVWVLSVHVWPALWCKLGSPHLPPPWQGDKSPWHPSNSSLSLDKRFALRR